MSDRVGDWVALVDGLYPEADAAAWDRTGLQVGDPDAAVDAVLVCLDVTAETLAEAEQARAGLVLAHHPLLLRPLERLSTDTAPGRLALHAARTGIALLAAHTNFDAAVPGTTEPVMALLGITRTTPLQPLPAGQGSVKLVTFVPPEHTSAVLAALSEAGAGAIGEYDECSFRLRGTGTFRPSPAASPTVGEQGRRNEVSEDRLEVVVPRARLPAVVDALLQTHPYEEVAYDLYPLLDPPTGKGAGRVGDLPEPLTLRMLADRLAGGLPAPGLRVAGDLDRTVRRVAACGGAGDGYIPAALAAGADVYVTGDLRHHVALDARTQGLALVDAGHYATEAAALPGLIGRLQAAAAERGLSARLVASAVRTDPWVDYRPASGGGT
jgi:dinuclear metal center YbgI/SA1388 family protein